MRIPGYYTYHWQNTGMPTGSWWPEEKTPLDTKYVRAGFIAVHHPEQEIECEKIMLSSESKKAYTAELAKPMEIGIKLGSRLTWRQRIVGIA